MDRCEGGEKCWHVVPVGMREDIKAGVEDLLTGQRDGFSFTVLDDDGRGILHTHNCTGAEALATLMREMKVGFWDAVRIWRLSKRYGARP